MLLPAHSRQTRDAASPRKSTHQGWQCVHPGRGLSWPSPATHLLHVVGPVASAALSTLEFSILHSSPRASPASSPALSRCFVILSQRGAWHSLYKRKGNPTRGPSSLAGGGAPPQPRPPRAGNAGLLRNLLLGPLGWGPRLAELVGLSCSCRAALSSTCACGRRSITAGPNPGRGALECGPWELAWRRAVRARHPA